MGERVETELIVKAISQGFAGVKKDIENLGKAGTSAGTGVKAANTSLGDMVQTIGRLQAGALVMAGVFKKAFDLAKEGAAIERTNMQLGRLAATIDSTAEAIMGRLGEATRGMIPNAQLAASAAQIISLGLATTEDDVVRLATVVGRLGLDMNQVILTFANNSIMRLDALGLSVDDVRARTAAFEAQGFDANKAFDTAVLEALEAKLQTLGGGIVDNAAIFARFETQIKNISDAFKVWLAEGLTPVLAAITGLNSQKLEQIVDTQRDAATTIREYVIAGKRLSEVADMWGGLATAITGTTGTVRDKLRDIATDIALNTGNMAEFKTAFERAFSYGAQTDILRVGTAAEVTLREFFILANEAERLAQALANSYQPATSQAKTETEKLAAAAEDAGIAIRDGTGKVVGWVGMMEMLGTGTHTAALSARELAGATYEVRDAVADTAPMQKYSDILLEMAARMAAQRDANRQARVEFNAGITDYLEGKENADLYTTALENLGRTTHTYTTIVAGNSEELERLQGVYDRTLQDIRDYEAGIKGVGMSEDAHAKKLEELRLVAANTQTAMAGLGEVTAVTGSVFTAAKFDAQLLRAALLEQSIAAGAGIFPIQQLMEATGLYSEEQIKAALNAGAMQEKIGILSGMIAEGKITVEDAIKALDRFAEALSKPFGIYIELGPLHNAISELEHLIQLYGTAAGLAGAIDAGLVGSGSSSGGTGGTGGTFEEDGDLDENGPPYYAPIFTPGNTGVVNQSTTSNANNAATYNIYVNGQLAAQIQGRMTAGTVASQIGVRG